MTELSFHVEDVFPEPFAVAPNLTARVEVTESSGAAVHALAVRCQVRIDPQRRRYTDGEAEGLLDLFGPRERWTATLKPFQWMQTSTVAQGFTGSSVVELPLPCTYDFEVTASKYLHALDEAGSTVRSCSCSAGRSSPAGSPVSGWNGSRGTASRPTTCRSACGANWFRRTTRTRVGAPRPRHARRAGALQGGARSDRTGRRHFGPAAGSREVIA